MDNVRVTHGIVPLGEFKARASRILRGLDESSTPVVITVNGRAAGVVLSPSAFDELRDRQRFLESVLRGVEDAEGGHVMGTEELRRQLRERRSRRAER